MGTMLATWSVRASKKKRLMGLDRHTHRRRPLLLC